MCLSIPPQNSVHGRLPCTLNSPKLIYLPQSVKIHDWVIRFRLMFSPLRQHFSAYVRYVLTFADCTASIYQRFSIALRERARE